MMKWTTTTQHWLMLGAEVDERLDENRRFLKGISDWIYYAPDEEGLSRMLQELIQDANETQKEIKSVTPLTQSTAHRSMHAFHDTSTSPDRSWGLGWGIGVGFGASYTAGFLVIIQQHELVTEDEFKQRLQAVQDRKDAERRAIEAAALKEKQQNELTDLLKVKADAEGSVSELRSKAGNLEQLVERSKEITTKKKALRGVVYVVADVEHKSMELAQIYQTTVKEEHLSALAELEEALQQSDEIKAKIEMLQNALA
ncbi:hypothetical protein [Ruegeria arenilitoris]|uniref:hypothetical protein n=1 Tax=Ruegeria arenilitoris TaxID=1173585 RepID=UPI00147D61B4|nr:hypothetical protein [Ruegeria arenilitoris]